MSARFDAAVARRLRFVQDATLHPGGELVAYTLRTQPDGARDDVVELWWHDLRAARSTRVAAPAVSFAKPRWSSSGHVLAVRARADSHWRLHLLAPGALELPPAHDLPGEVLDECVWHGDDRLALVLARAEDREPEEGRPYRVTDDVWERDGIGRVDRATTDLWELRLDGTAPRRLTDSPSAKSAPRWSPSGGRLLVRDAALERTAAATLQVLEPATGASTEVVGADWRPASGAWCNDDAVVFAGRAPGAIAGSAEHVFLVELGGDAPIADRSAGFEGTISGFLDGDLPTPAYWDATPIFVDAEGGSAIVRAQVGGACAVLSVDLDGPQRWRAVLGGARACHPLDVDGGRRLLALTSAFDAPPEVVLCELASGDERTLTDLNADALAGVAFAPLRPLSTRDGDGLDSWYAAPPDGGPGPWPTVMILHGGPHAASGELFHMDAQLLLGAGIGVLLVNHRGSTGYGDAFGTALRGRWGSAAVADATTALDAAIARGWADPARLGVHGQSAGGTLTCWLASRTTRFAAAVAENAATNFVSLLGSCDIATELLPDLLGDPRGGGLRNWVEASPIGDARACRTPMLLIQAEDDRRCPPEQGEQLYRLLRLHGCEAQMLRLPGGTHDASVLGEPALRRAQEEALVEWFERHLLT